jgi:hypothetical protein
MTDSPEMAQKMAELLARRKALADAMDKAREDAAASLVDNPSQR